MVVDRDQVDQVARGDQRPVVGHDQRPVQGHAALEPGWAAGVAQLVEDEGHQRVVDVELDPVVGQLGPQAAGGSAQLNGPGHRPTIRAVAPIGTRQARWPAWWAAIVAAASA